jgi:hypothetical protein
MPWKVVAVEQEDGSLECLGIAKELLQGRISQRVWQFFWQLLVVAWAVRQRETGLVWLEAYF